MAERKDAANDAGKAKVRNESVAVASDCHVEDARISTLFSRMKGQSVGRLSWGIAILTWVLLLYAYLWPPDFRNRSTPYICLSWLAFMLSTFLFHIGLVMGTIGAIAVVSRRWLLLGFLLPMLLWTIGPSLWLFIPRASELTRGNEITMMSVNLLMINKQTAPIISEVLAANPDVLLLQEYAPHWHRAFQNALLPTYPYVAHKNRSDSFGLAIYSKLPFSSPPQLDLTLGHSNYPQICAVVSIGQDKDLAIYNLHLVPPSNMDLIVEHRLQLADLIEVLTAESLPMIAAGDFNFTNDSPHAAAIFNIGLHDAHAQSGIGRGSTWPNTGLLQWLPGVQIDHMFLGPTITAMSCKTGQGQGSDHRPIVSTIVVP